MVGCVDSLLLVLPRHHILLLTACTLFYSIFFTPTGSLVLIFLSLPSWCQVPLHLLLLISKVIFLPSSSGTIFKFYILLLFFFSKHLIPLIFFQLSLTPPSSSSSPFSFSSFYPNSFLSFCFSSLYCFFSSTSQHPNPFHYSFSLSLPPTPRSSLYPSPYSLPRP